MKYIIEYLIVILVTYYIGIGFTALLWRNKAEKYLNIMTLFTGLAVTIILIGNLSLIGIPTDISKYILVAIATVVNVIGIVVKKRRKEKIFRITLNEGIILLIAIVSGAIVLIPVVFYNGFFAYGDGFTYIAIADYLADFGYFKKALPGKYYPWLTQMKLYQDAGFRMGAQYYLSFIKEILFVEFSFEVFSVCIAIGQMLFVLAISFLSSYGLKLKEKTTLIAAILSGVCISISINNLMTGFLPQGYGIAIMLIVFALFLNIKERDSIVSQGVLVAVFCATLVMTYSEILPFTVIGVGCIVIYKFFADSKEEKKVIVIKSILVIFLAILLSNVFFINSINAILIQSGVVVGWNVNYTLWNYICILFSFDVIYKSSPYVLKYPILYLGTTLFIFSMILMIIRNFIFNSEYRKERINIGLLTFPFALMLIVFLFFTSNPWNPNELGHSWNIFKIVSYTAFIVIIPWAIGLDTFINKSKWHKRIGITILCIYVMGEIVFGVLKGQSNAQTMATLTGNEEDSMAQYYAIYETYRGNTDPIRIITPPEAIKHKQMLTYFLREHPIIADWSDDDGYIAYYLDYNDSTVFDEGKVINLEYNQEAENKIANMVELLQNVTLETISGVYNAETDGQNAWRWAYEDIVYDFNIFGSESVPIMISFEIGHPLPEAQSVKVWVGDELIDIIEIESGALFEYEAVINLNESNTNVRLEFSGEAKQYGEDPRNLGMIVYNFNYNEME